VTPGLRQENFRSKLDALTDNLAEALRNGDPLLDRLLQKSLARFPVPGRESDLRITEPLRKGLNGEIRMARVLKRICVLTHACDAMREGSRTRLVLFRCSQISLAIFHCRK
jgi:hypothetical protein